MKKWFKKVKDWCFWNNNTIAMGAKIVGVVLLITALVIALVIAINTDGKGEGMSKETAWLINPANPASPIHLLP